MEVAAFAGRWRIDWMSGWDQDYVDLEVPGHISFDKGNACSFQFGLLHGQMDCRVDARLPQRVEFTWCGFDERDELTGRGHAEIVDGELRGHLYFHHGDDCAFHAVRQTAGARRAQCKRRAG